MARINSIGMMLLTSALACSAPAYSAAIAFDCDVPPNRLSSVSQDFVGPITVRGYVKLVEMRSGNNLPVAGARIVSSDNRSSVGFQLVAASPRAKRFDIFLFSGQRDDPERRTIGQIATNENISFSLSLDDTGKATLSIGGNRFDADFIPLSGGKAIAFCSTAQFKFEGLSFSQSVETGATDVR